MDQIQYIEENRRLAIKDSKKDTRPEVTYLLFTIGDTYAGSLQSFGNAADDEAFFGRFPAPCNVIERYRYGKRID